MSLSSPGVESRSAARGLDERTPRPDPAVDVPKQDVERKRAESSALFAMLSGQHVGDALRMPANDRIKAGAQRLVGR